MDCKNATWKVAAVWRGLNSYIRRDHTPDVRDHTPDIRDHTPDIP